jgi:hypothetical protein
MLSTAAMPQFAQHTSASVSAVPLNFLLTTNVIAMIRTKQRIDDKEKAPRLLILTNSTIITLRLDYLLLLIF